LFPPGAAGAGIAVAELLRVADGLVEDFEGGLLGGNWPRLRVTLRSRAFIDSIRLVV
jgi:hypothetical protein